MKEKTNENKRHIILSFIIAFILSMIIGSSIGLKIDSLGWGISAGIISLILHISALLIIYTLTKINSWYANYLPLIFILLTFLIIIIVIPNTEIVLYQSTRKTPERILYFLDKWNFQSSLMRIVQTLLALVSIVCSLLVAMQINNFKSSTIKWMAFVSALSVGILTSFNFGEKANNFRTAWRMLNTAVMLYESSDNYPIEELINVYYEAENTIGDSKIKLK